MCVIQSYGQQGSLLRKNMLMLLGLISDRSFVEGAIERVSAYPPSSLYFVREFPYTHSLLRYDFAQPALPVIGTIFWGILPNVLSLVIYEVTKVRIGGQWPQNRKSWVCSSIQVQKTSCWLGLQLYSFFCPFSIHIFASWGDRVYKLSLGYDIPSDPNSSLLAHSSSFIFSAGSSLMTNPNIHTLMSIHAMYHY